MMTSDFAQYLLLVLIVGAAFVAIIKRLTSKANTIKNPEDLINLLISEAKEKVIPFITKLAFEEKLDGCNTYTEFKEMCATHFTTKIVEFLEVLDNRQDFNIPDSLEVFITEENIRKVVDRIFEYTEVDDMLHGTYLNLIDKRYKEIEEEEKKIANRNAEIGVEDDEALVKEDLGIVVKDDDKSDNMINIDGELNNTVDERDLIEVLADPED